MLMIGGGQNPQGVRLQQGERGPGGRGKLFFIFFLRIFLRFICCTVESDEDTAH